MSTGKDGCARVGLIGCGNISERYVAGIRRFPQLSLVGCADADQSRATAMEGTHGVRAFPSVDALINADEVDVLVNITPPVAHAEVSIAGMRAGKDVYVEKPLAATLPQAGEVLDVARESGRLIGCAPDTFLGSAIQTARAAVDAGLIGEPLGATAFVSHSHAEEWHPDPRFLFSPGGGPLLDMGPYYATALVSILGPVAEVAGHARIGATPRVVTAPDRLVESFEVTVPTHTSASLRFEGGQIGTLVASFDLWHRDYPHVEIIGTEGALRLFDPNDYDGDVTIRGNRESDWRVLDPVLPISGGPGPEYQMLRGIGVADLVAAGGGAPHHASGALAYHVLEVLQAVEDSGREQRYVQIASTVERPEPLTADSPLLPWAHAAA